MNKLISICILAFSVSCNLFEADEAFEVPHKDLLIRNRWMLVAYTQSPAYNGVTDVFAVMDKCAKDNLYIFKADGSYIFDAGFNKCSASEPQINVAGTWRFGKKFTGDTDEEKLIITASGKETIYFIEIITDSRLKLFTSQTSAGNTYTLTQTFRNK